RIDGDNSLLFVFWAIHRSLSGGVEAAIWTELHAADFRAVFEPRRNFAVHAHSIKSASRQIAKVEIAFRIAAAGIPESVTFANQFPATLIGQDLGERFVTGEVILGERLSRDNFSSPQPA